MNNNELKTILENHKKWLKSKGKEGKRAYLSNVDLSYADLRDVDLSNVDLSYAILEEVDLSNVDLSYAKLSDAILFNADLSYADLSYADLSYAKLNCADLSYANLRHANFRYADLRDADLSYANLRHANLSDAILFNVDLSCANLHNTKIVLPIACPETGSFIGYKKANGFIVKLEIPEDAKRSSATSRNCRCNKAKVISIENIDGTVADVTSVCSTYDRSFIYTIGETVEVSDFCEDRWNEFSPGIHFFITREEAVNY